MKKRISLPERMDDPNLPLSDHEKALIGLSRLNRWSGIDSNLWRVLRSVAMKNPQTPLKVLDIATGSGDLPIRLFHRAHSENLDIHFSACDLNENALNFARQAASDQQAIINFFQLDAVNDTIPSGYDIILVSLFLHHLSDEQIVNLLSRLSRATAKMIIVNDLSRSWWNYFIVTLASRILSRSSVVHYDGPISVRAAFTKSELQHLATQAGLENVIIRSQFPARWLMIWEKS